MLLVYVTLIYLVGSTCGVNVDYYDGRSGDIIIQSDNDIIQDSAVLLHGKQFETVGLKAVEDVRVADLFAHVMGAQPFNTNADREGFPKSSLFDKSKASLIIVLDSVSPDAFTKLSSWKDYKRVDVTTQSFPASTLTVASNLITGTTPSVHGVVGQSWLTPSGLKVDSQGSSMAANMADVLTQEWSGSSLVISASASASLASIFAVHEKLYRPNSYGFYLKRDSFESIYALPPTSSINLAATETVLRSDTFSSFFGISIEDKKVTVTESARSVVFDMSASEDSKFFAELVVVYNLLTSLESDAHLSALISDDIPDFFSFAFSSLKGIKEKYGVDSDAFAVAIVLVDRVAQQAVSTIEKLYGGRAVSAIACLNTRTEVSRQTKNAVYQKARKFLQKESEFDAHYPNLYIRGSEIDSACLALRKSVETPSVKVHCFASSYNYVFDTPYNNNTNTTTTLNVPAFWILLSMSIILTLLILAGVWALFGAGVEAASNSLLFRSAGRHHHQM